MLVEFSILPVGKGESLSEYVARVVGIVAKSSLPYKVTEMGTIVEGEWEDVFSLIQRCHRTLLGESGRLVTTIKIDDRKGKADLLKTRLASLESKAGKFNQ